MTQLEEIKQELHNNQSDLAFIVGNGINRFKDSSKSWKSLLLNIWQQSVNQRKNEFPFGISLPEIYDIIELEAAPNNDVKSIVITELGKWKHVDYHEWLQNEIKKWGIPLLTTNFDENIDNGLRRRILGNREKGFTDFYPWNVYFSDRELSSPIDGFGIWHINGMLSYKRSIRLSLSEYLRLSARVRAFLHKEKGTDSFDLINQNCWKGGNTWLHIIFNKSLCIFGLALERDEIFLRWLLIERARFFKTHPEYKKKGWYVCCKDDEENIKGKEFYLKYVGFELVKLDDYKSIYEDLVEYS